MTLLYLSYIALWTVFLWFVCRLVRWRRNVPLRAIVAFFGFQILGHSVTFTILADLVGARVVSTSVTRLVQNLGLCASWCALLLFFLFAAGVRSARTRAVVETCVAFAVGSAMSVAIILIPDPSHDDAFPSLTAVGDLTLPQVRTFYALATAYLGYSSVQVARSAWAYAHECTRRTRQGLRVAVIGIAVMGTGSLLRAVEVLIGSGSGDLLSAVVAALVPVGMLLFAVGASYGAVLARLAGLRVWLRHRRLHHELAPLWSVLHRVFPEDALDRESRSLWRDRISPVRMHHRYWRRRVEIRDGLVQLSPHLADAGFTLDQATHEQIDVFVEALERQRRGQRADTDTAILVAPATRSGPGADVEPLLDLARAFAREGIA